MKASEYCARLHEAREHSLIRRWDVIIAGGVPAICEFCNIPLLCVHCPVRDDSFYTCCKEWKEYRLQADPKKKKAAAIIMRQKILDIDVDAWTAFLVQRGVLEADDA